MQFDNIQLGCVKWKSAFKKIFKIILKIEKAKKKFE